MSLSYILAVVLASLSFSYPITNAFSFTTNGTPSQCDHLGISWTGGTAPFQLLVIPAFGVPQNVSIPAAAFSNGQGTFSFPVSFPVLPANQNQNFVLTMSDATGFGTGGTTQLLTIQPSLSCNTTGPSLGFSFQLNSALQQCRPYIFSDYSTAVQPVIIMGVIPGGQSFVLSPPAGPTFSWNTNVARGTSIMFLMIDALGRQGGSSDVKTVGSSDDSSCLNSQSPSSTSAAPSSTTGSTVPTNTASSTPGPTTAAGGTPIGAIAGTVIGALLFLAVVISLTLFFLKKRRDSSVNRGNFRVKSTREHDNVDLTLDPNSQPLGHSYPFSSSSSAALAAASNPYPYHNPHPHDVNPFSDIHSPSITNDQLHPFQFQSSMPPSPYQRFSSTPSQFSPPARYQSSLYTSNASEAAVDPFNPMPSAEIDPYPLHSPGQSTSRGSMSTAQRKAAMAGLSSYKPSRFILHTDVDDEIPQVDEHGVVELPPQYSETRRALTVSNPSGPDASSRESPRPVSEYGSFYPPA